MTDSESLLALYDLLGGTVRVCIGDAHVVGTCTAVIAELGGARQARVVWFDSANNLKTEWFDHSFITPASRQNSA